MARAGRDITFRSDGEDVGAYLATPPSGRGPGVLVLHERFGLVDAVRDVCDRLAREGFVALAPDLYRGEVAPDAETARRWMEGLDATRAAGDLDAAVEVLHSEDATDGPKVGCVGFDAGGPLALAAGARNRRVGAVADVYGVGPAEGPDLAGLEAPVLGIFGERDEQVPPQAARKLESDLESAGKRATILVYPGVHHAFMNPARPDAYHAETAARAWGELLAFLRAELGA